MLFLLKMTKNFSKNCNNEVIRFKNIKNLKKQINKTMTIFIIIYLKRTKTQIFFSISD